MAAALDVVSTVEMKRAVLSSPTISQGLLGSYANLPSSKVGLKHSVLNVEVNGEIGSASALSKIKARPPALSNLMNEIVPLFSSILEAMFRL
jgi:hypothetical protein